MKDWRRRSRWGRHLSGGRTGVGDGRSPLVPLCPRDPATLAHRHTPSELSSCQTWQETTSKHGHRQQCHHLHCRNILSGKTVCGVGYQHTSFAHRTISHHHTLDRSATRHDDNMLLAQVTQIDINGPAMEICYTGLSDIFSVGVTILGSAFFGGLIWPILPLSKSVSLSI